jgi:hypothetical protein
MQIGIDKLKFSSPGYRVKDWHSSGLTMRPSDIVAGKEQVAEPFCIKDSRGHKVEGTKAFLNDELFSLTIDPTSARLEFNPSKPYHAYQLCSDEKTLNGRIDNVLLTLEQTYGIQLDLSEAKVRRIDLAKNMSLNNPVSHYSDVFSVLKCKRQKRSGTYNQETFNFGTAGTRFFQFYNKGLELEEDNYPSEVTMPLGMKFMRGEIQLKGTGIHSALGMKTFDHFMQTGFDFYQGKYCDLMQKELFRYQSLDSEEFQMSVQYEHDFLIEELKRFRQRFRNGYLKFVFAYGSQNVLQMFGGTKAFREAVLIASGGNRSTADRVLKEVQSAMFDCRLPDQKQLVKMYSELRTKFAS